MKEEPVLFDCEGDTLVGLLSLPASGSARLGVVVVTGGPQYRAGSHRQFTALCRALAQAGVAALRFDFRGMGDSSGSPRAFDSLDADIEAAVSALRTRLPSIDQTVLWGLCDGASAALLYCRRRPDKRISALCLLNPWVRSSETLARAHVKHYYLQRVLQRDFWVKLLRGGVGSSAVRGLLQNLATASRGPTPAGTAAPAEAGAGFQVLMLQGALAFDGPMLLVLSGRDYTAKEFLEQVAADASWSTCLARPGVRRLDLPNADHTFSDLSDGGMVERTTVAWLRERVGA